MYSKLPNIVFGFHGCKKEVFDRVVKEGGNLSASTNDYDWLGPGIYFWEDSPERALQWAKDRYGEDARVIGAALDLGNCLNLTDFGCIQPLKYSYEITKLLFEHSSFPLPENKRLIRKLDCAVINTLHKVNELRGLPPYDSVRGVFLEGNPIYEGSGFMEKTHIQLAICNPNCVKAYFEPRELDARYQRP